MDAAGQHLLAHASTTPDKPAVVMHGAGTVHTYRDVADRSGRLARALWERGVRKGGHVAVLLDNQGEFYDVVWAAIRLGAHVTPINWHLLAAEAGYIVDNCDASVFVTTSRLGEVVGGMGAHLTKVDIRVCVDGELPGFERLDDLVAGVEPGLGDDEAEGGWMFYSSGTTGQPKGILPPLPDGDIGAPSFLTQMLSGMFGFDERTVYLSPGAPLYHAAPAGWTYGTQRLGGTAVVMERFDPLEVLAAIERHRVTHVQFVPTHMIRLMKLADEDRARFDLSSLQVVVHAAAPCPVETKRRFIDWVGPIVHEFYSGTEGVGLTYIGSEEWLAHPGSVGRSMTGPIHVLDGDGDELPPGEEGEIWFSTDRSFEYHREPEKTRAVFDRRGWAWMGDVGWVDEDGYLYLTDRAANMIISGGVNIYPREVEDVLVVHPAIDDVAVLGTPDPDLGEHVTAFVQRAPGADLDAAEIVAWCRSRLSHFKCPREVRFVDELPRLPTGKLLKRLLVAPDPLRSGGGSTGQGTRIGREPGERERSGRATTKPAPALPTADDVRRAAERIAPHAHRTPVLRSRVLDELVGIRVHFKAEHLQRAGAFKFRGATNAVLALDDDTAARGVAAHSSGNHAAALALAASTRGIPCHVVMPADAPRSKQAATAGYGARIVLCEPTLEARASTLAEVLARTGATEIHPYDHPDVIAGQGTATLELLEEEPAIGAVIAPVSGGGLLSGTAIAAHGVDPGIAVHGAEPVAVDDAARSLAAGRRIPDGNSTSIADGLLAVLSDRTFTILSDHDVRVVTVSEDEIVDAMALLFTRLKQVVEPSGATALAGLLALARLGAPLPPDVGVILSGGNVDLDHLPFGAVPS